MNKTDLLIMGSTGRSGLGRMLLGSVTEKVTREFPCSFATLKAENILIPDLTSSAQDISKHYLKAEEHMLQNKLQEAIAEYMICIHINEMHIPSLLGLANANKKLGNMESAEAYKNIAHEVMIKISDINTNKRTPAEVQTQR
jgi:hypothetical protein